MSSQRQRERKSNSNLIQVEESKEKISTDFKRQNKAVPFAAISLNQKGINHLYESKLMLCNQCGGNSIITWSESQADCHFPYCYWQLQWLGNLRWHLIITFLATSTVRVEIFSPYSTDSFLQKIPLPYCFLTLIPNFSYTVSDFLFYLPHFKLSHSHLLSFLHRLPFVFLPTSFPTYSLSPLLISVSSLHSVHILWSWQSQLLPKLHFLTWPLPTFSKGRPALFDLA